MSQAANDTKKLSPVARNAAEIDRIVVSLTCGTTDRAAARARLNELFDERNRLIGAPVIEVAS